MPAMPDDETVIMRWPVSKGICVRLSENTVGAEKNPVFTRAFTIGRQSDCDLRFQDDRVSRHHAEIYPTTAGWAIRDLGSANGTLLAGMAIDRTMPISGKTEIQLGCNGPTFLVEPILESQKEERAEEQSDVTHIRTPAATPGSTEKQPLPDHTVIRPHRHVLNPEEIRNHYFGDQEDAGMGDRTLLLRKLIMQEQKKQSRRYRLVIVSISLVLLAVSGLAGYQQQRLAHAQKLAVDIFYDMKTLEVQIVREEAQRHRTAYLVQQNEISRKREQLQAMERRYNEYLNNLKGMRLFRQPPSRDVEIIHHMARIFGESELLAPEDFVQEVKKYIELWKSTRRLPLAITRLQRNNLTPILVSALQKQNLPAQFLYLSLQESNFKKEALGPETRYGIAKGPWQFIPATAAEYGLRLGPLASKREYDPADERFDFAKASTAAAHYLKDIYGNEAQASGLLVMASYNWGHNRVRKLIARMPENPRDRNFWQLIKKYRIPKETYDYVFYIFSAAVIGEDPQYFGFNFANPLQEKPAS